MQLEQSERKDESEVQHEQRPRRHSDDGDGIDGEKEQGDSHDANSDFECNICLSPASDPVITLCGHLYCWPCLYQWLYRGQETCPVCKAGVTKNNVIPLYGRGKAKVDPRTKAFTHEEIPQRPAGQRPQPNQDHFGRFRRIFRQPYEANFAFGGGFGLFPGAFGWQFGGFNDTQQQHNGGAERLEENATFAQRAIESTVER